MLNFKNSNTGKIKIKILATMLILTLTLANFVLLRKLYKQINSG